MELLDRSDVLARLDEIASQVNSSGRGAVTTVFGESGIGKSAVIDHSRRQLSSSGVPIFLTACSPLKTARPLQAIEDLLKQCLHSDSSLSSTEIKQRFSTWLESDAGKLIWIVEDIHWADTATLDLLQSVVSRITKTRGLLVLTYRDKGRTLERLRPLISTVRSQRGLFIRLSGLSVDASRQLLGKPTLLQLLEAHRITKGNPLHLKAIALTAQKQSKAIALDSMVERALSGANDGVIRLVGCIALFPDGCDAALLESLGEFVNFEGPVEALIDEALTTNLIEQNWPILKLAHDLLREAVLKRIGKVISRSLSTILLKHCTTLGKPAELLLHFAELAKSTEDILRLVPLVARNARRAGSHPEAYSNFSRARSALTLLPIETQAEVLEGWAFERTAVQWADMEVAEALRQAAELWRLAGKIERSGEALRLLAFGLWLYGLRSEAVSTLNLAIHSLELTPPCRSLALAYALQSKVHLASCDYQAAHDSASKALDFGRLSGDLYAKCHALIYLGTTALRQSDLSGELLLTEAIRIARSLAAHEAAADAYHNLIESLLKIWQFTKALNYAEDALKYLHFLGVASTYVLGLHAIALSETSSSALGERPGNKALDSELSKQSYLRWPVLWGQSVCASRRGSKSAIALLKESFQLALDQQFTQDIIPSGLALVEHYYLQGDIERAQRHLTETWESKGNEKGGWLIGGLLVWSLRLSLALKDAEFFWDLACLPARLEREGKCQKALEIYLSQGAKAQAALLLCGQGGESREKIVSLAKSIGAKTILKFANEREHEKGVAKIKRSINGATALNSLGLTKREDQIFGLLKKGLHNQDIADELSRSSRTVEHHIEKVLKKLGKKRSDLIS